MKNACKERAEKVEKCLWKQERIAKKFQKTCKKVKKCLSKTIYSNQNLIKGDKNGV